MGWWSYSWNWRYGGRVAQLEGEGIAEGSGYWEGSGIVGECRGGMVGRVLCLFLCLYGKIL